VPWRQNLDETCKLHDAVQGKMAKEISGKSEYEKYNFLHMDTYGVLTEKQIFICIME
jgi:hypothetical protein